jgi:hypothetical protein
MKRVKLKHGSARVSDSCDEKTIKALNKMSELAYTYSPLSKLTIEDLVKFNTEIDEAKIKDKNLIQQGKNIYCFDKKNKRVTKTDENGEVTILNDKQMTKFFK